MWGLSGLDRGLRVVGVHRWCRGREKRLALDEGLILMALRDCSGAGPSSVFVEALQWFDWDWRASGGREPPGLRWVAHSSVVALELGWGRPDLWVPRSVVGGNKQIPEGN